MTATELERLLARALANYREEPAFFKALLEATVYAHVPLSDDSGRLKFIQFTRPDNGEKVLPLFIDESKAYAMARQAGVGVIAMRGRDLMEHTQGAILMIDANDHHCTLYPEEIATLLDTTELSVISSEHMEAGAQVCVSVPTDPPRALLAALEVLYTQLGFVEAAYCAEIRRGHDVENSTLIAIKVEPAHAEHAIRASMMAVQPFVHALTRPLDFAAYDPAAAPYAMLSEVEPFYSRTI